MSSRVTGDTLPGGSEPGQHVVGVGLDVYLLPDVSNGSVGADEVGHPPGVGRFPIVGGAVSQAQRLVGVAEQAEGEAILFRENGVLGLPVERRAQDDRPLRLELADSIPEPAAFEGSTWGVGDGEEPEHDGLAAQVGQAHRFAGVRQNGEVGRWLAYLKKRHAPILPEVGYSITHQRATPG